MVSLEIRIWSPLESQRLSPKEKSSPFLLDHAGQGRGRRKGRAISLNLKLIFELVLGMITLPPFSVKHLVLYRALEYLLL